MKIGYARVSTNTQDLTLQVEALKKAGCEKIYSESLSGKDNERPELKKMLDHVRKDDIVVVYKIDRIARSLKGLMDIIELLNYKKVNLLSLDAGDKVDTTSPMGKAFFQIAGVFAELERGMIKERTTAGIERAKANGIRFGRIHGSTNKKTVLKRERIQIYLKAGKSYDWIVKELGVSKQTIVEVKKSLNMPIIPKTKKKEA